MRGLWFENGTARLREDLSSPSAQPGCTRIRVTRAGVCATDLALRRGYMDFTGVPGHEFVGVAMDGPLAGQRVVGDINAGCGQCRSCREDNSHHCPQRTVLGILDHPGAFAEELILPDRNLVPVPDHVSDDAAVFTEPLAAALEIAEQVDLHQRRVLVAGDGRLGILICHAVAIAGGVPTCAGRHPERRGLLPDSATHVTGLLEDDAPERAFHVAVEATGDPEVLPRLMGHVRPRGTVVLKTTTERPTTMDLAPLVVDEITLVGSRCGPFHKAMTALADGAVDPRPMIVARYPLADAARGIEHAGQPGVLKVLMDG